MIKIKIILLLSMVWGVQSNILGQDSLQLSVDSLWIYLPGSDLRHTAFSDTARNDSTRTRYTLQLPEKQFRSPEATAFKKYGEYQVNEYTGNPNISIPLYTLKYKDVEVPITLAYDASGIQVDQEASWVGLGWNLTIGGCINYVTSGNVDPANLFASQTAWEGFLSTGNTDFNQFTTGFTSNTTLKEDILAGAGERDYYSVRILDKSFFFASDPFTHQCFAIGKDKDLYHVEPINTSTSAWKITDADGYQYFFDIGEVTTAIVIGGLYTSTWYLSEIVSPEGSIVNFNYSSGFQNCPGFRVEQYDIVSGSDPSYYPYTGYNSQMSQTNINVSTKYVSSIETEDQIITFTLGSERNDLPGAKRLEKFVVKSKLSQANIKEFVFNYSYFSASTVGGNYDDDQIQTTSYSEELGLRLKLNSVSECAGNEVLTTSFNYNDNILLPLKTSCARDFWGYYNNCENRGSGEILNPHTLLPTPLPLFINSGITLTPIYRTLKGATRYCNETSMQAAILKKITYPTKGYTCFTYEPHNFISQKRYPTVSGYSACHQTVTLSDNNNPQASTHQQISLVEKAYGMIKVTFSGNLSNLYSAGAKVSIISMNPNAGTSYYYDLSLASSNDLAYGTYFTTEIPVDLLATNYMLTVYCPDALGTTGYYVSATLELTQAFGDSNVPVSTGGGLRIKKIENFNHDNLLQNYTEYSYADSTGMCSGKLLQPLAFSKSMQISCIYQNGTAQPGDVSLYDYNVHRLLMPSPDMTSFYASISGGTVGYTYVSKNQYDGNGVLQKAVTTTYQNNLPQNLYNIYYFNNADNGNVISQKVKNPDGTTLQRTDYSYSNEVQTYHSNAIVEDRFIDYSLWGYNIESPYFGRFLVRTYPFKTFWSKLNQVVETKYDNSKAQSITSLYTYNATNHQVKSRSLNSSDSNISYIEEYKYPSDFEATPVCSMMYRNPYYMLNTIIEESLSAIEGGVTKLVRSKRNTYTGFTDKCRDATFNNRVFLPTAESYAMNGGSQELRVSYSYNDYCDLRSVMKDGEAVAYLWAYNNMYPVAEIRGATYSDLFGWGLTSLINSLSTKTSTTEVSSVLSSIRSSLANKPVLVTSYTYDPLIGITSMTKPNGTKTSYEYDVMGRLSKVRNHDSSIIQRHEYHYKQ